MKFHRSLAVLVLAAGFSGGALALDDARIDVRSQYRPWRA